MQVSVKIYLIIWTHLLLAKNEDNFMNRKFHCPYSFIHFRARFSFGEGRGAAALGEIPRDQQQS